MATRKLSEYSPIPDTLGRYRVLEHLASGGMGDVFVGKVFGPGGFERPIILKRILPHYASRPEFVKMFLDEARIIAGIRHPNVVQVHDLVYEQEELFLVMEYLSGETLSVLFRELRNQRKSLDYALSAYIISEVCAGLHSAHELRDADGQLQNVVHRDVSPQNIFVTYSGGIKILDFGIAKASTTSSETKTGQVKGKTGYMAPEQCRGKPLDRRADIFSLGIILYEMTTGQRLFSRETEMMTYEAICYDPILPPTTFIEGYPAELERVCLTALERDKEKRYPTAADMRRDLAQVLQHLKFHRLEEEALATHMQELFQDSIHEKERMLARLRAEGEHSTTGFLRLIHSRAEAKLSSSPERDVAENPEDKPEENVLAEPTSKIQVHMGSPSAKLAAPSSLLPTSHEIPKLLSKHPNARLSFWMRAAAAMGFVALVGVVFLGYLALRVANNPATESRSTSQTPPASNVHTQEIKRVHMVIETTPKAAQVFIQNEFKGVTPVTLEFPSSQERITLRVQKEAYQPYEEAFVPNTDQRLLFALQPLPKKTTKSQPKSTPVPTKSSPFRPFR